MATTRHLVVLIYIMLALNFTNALCETHLVVNIKGNGLTNQVTLKPNDALSIKVDMSPGDSLGANADWWIVAKSPSNHWYSWIYPMGWVYSGTDSQVSVAYQGPLFALGPFEILNTSNLGEGDYYVYFGIDTDMNGVIDLKSLAYSEIKVTVSPPELTPYVLEIQRTWKLGVSGSGGSYDVVVQEGTKGDPTVKIPFHLVTHKGVDPRFPVDKVDCQSKPGEPPVELPPGDENHCTAVTPFYIQGVFKAYGGDGCPQCTISGDGKRTWTLSGRDNGPLQFVYLKNSVTEDNTLVDCCGVQRKGTDLVLTAEAAFDAATVDWNHELHRWQLKPFHKDFGGGVTADVNYLWKEAPR